MFQQALPKTTKLPKAFRKSPIESHLKHLSSTQGWEESLLWTYYSVKDLNFVTTASFAKFKI